MFFSSDQNAWQAKARFLVGGEEYYATPSRVLMHWGAFSGGWWAPRFWVAPLRGGWWLRHRRPARAYLSISNGKKISKRKALKI
jgi:hypothetical protein